MNVVKRERKKIAPVRPSRIFPRTSSAPSADWVRTPLRRKSNGITPKRVASAALFVFDEDLREGVSTYIEAFANRAGGKFADWLRSKVGRD